MTDEKWREETGKLHSRVNEIGERVAELKTELKTDIAVIGTKLDGLREDIRNGRTKSTMSQRGMFMIATALISGLFALVAAAIALLK